MTVSALLLRCGLVLTAKAKRTMAIAKSINAKCLELNCATAIHTQLN